MKYLLIIIFLMSNLAMASNEVQIVNSKFESVVLKAKETNDFMPVWELFINTEFFVTVIPNDTGNQTQDFLFSIFKSKETKNEPVVLISEELNRLDNTNSGKAIKMLGGKLIQLLNSEVGVVIALNEGAFGMPKDIMQWLKSSLQNAH